METHKKKGANFIAMGFAVVVVAISASTSFGFFYTFFPGLLPGGIAATSIGALVSGAIGVALFDVACVVWLVMFLRDAETSEQRAISLIMTLVTFVGSAAASVAYLGLTATGEIALDAATKDTIGTFALVVVIVGVVANFGAMNAYQRYNLENKKRVREADRRDTLQEAENQQAAYLDKLIAQNVKEILTKQAPQLAQQQAQRIAEQFYLSEQSKYQAAQQEDSGSLLDDNSLEAITTTPVENGVNFTNGSGRA